MKLKMAKNSLFAVLLRSPWWISFAVVAVFGLASKALLPPQYVVFGWMGALPFLVIGVMAGYRQLRAPSAQQVDDILDKAAAMGWRDFSAALEAAYGRQGYQVQRLDGKQADLMLTRNGTTTLVSGKRWKAVNHGVEPLRALHEGRQARDASHCIYITLAQTNDNTQRFATQHRIDLVHGAALALLLRTGPGR